jgi:protocatechuate 3,4-dioxygenase beta subunit
MMRSLVGLVIVVFSLGFVSPSSTYAQVAGATLSGTVTDPSSAAVPNAQITITDVGKQTSRTVTTDSDGFYTAPNLVPGAYEVPFYE